MKLPRINIGPYPNSKEADNIREGFHKVNRAFDILDGTLTNQEVKATNFTPENGKVYLIDTTNGSVGITLPATPSEGFAFEVVDHMGYWNTNPVMVDPLTNNINGQNQIETLNTKYAIVCFRWIGYNIGWIKE